MRATIKLKRPITDLELDVDENSIVPKWIPCSERLPEYGVEVLTCDRDGDFCINHIIDDLFGDWFDDNNAPVAWCELPEPYREESNDQ